MGLAGAPIEGPTHFSQFDPLAVTLWGTAWFERGCISSHFRTMVVEGEQVQASLSVAGDGGVGADRGPQGGRDAGADRHGLGRPRPPDHRARGTAGGAG